MLKRLAALALSVLVLGPLAFAQDADRRTIPRLEVTDAFRPPARSSCNRLTGSRTGDLCWDTDDQILYIWSGTAWVGVGSGGGPGGSVSSVALAAPAQFTVTGSPVTGTGTLTLAWAAAGQGLFLATPAGGAGAPSLRAIAASDIPTLNQNTTGTAAALAADPLPCSAGQYGTDTNAAGALTCAQVQFSQVGGTVPLSQMANLAQDQFIGRVTASTGVPETATVTAAARTVLDDTTVGAMVDTLGGATSTGTGGLARATSPVFTTPNIGNATGNITGNAGTVSVADAAADTTTWCLFGGSATGSLGPLSDGDCTYDASANALTISGVLTAGSLVAGPAADGSRGVEMSANTVDVGAPAAGTTEWYAKGTSGVEAPYYRNATDGVQKILRALDVGAGLTMSTGPVTFDYSATLAGSPAMNAGECRFDSTDGTNQGGMICEGPTANTGEFLLQMGAAGAAGDRTTIVPMNTSTTAITLAAKDLAQTWSAVQTYSTTPIFQTGTTIGANADADLTLVTIDQGTGTDPSIGWLDTPARLDFNGMNFEMDPVNATAGVGTYWPISDPVSTSMYSGVGGFTFNGFQDNVICWAYNTDCSGTPTNGAEYAFNDVAEMSYDQSATAGRQTWIERNWNFKPVGVTQWRPFAFILDTTLNSAHGGAKWYWTPNDLNGGANVVAALDWPYVAFNFRSGTDVYTDAGASFWKRASSINPGGTEYGAKSVFYLDHTDDRSGPNQIGFYSLIDFNSTSPTAKAGNLYGGQTRARISGSTASRTVNSVTGWLLQTELASTNTGVTMADSYGLRAEMNYSGQNVTIANQDATIYLPTPTAPGTSTTINNHYGLWIEDQRYDRTGMSGGGSIYLSAQTTSNGGEGNFMFGGFGYNTGHFQWDSGGGAWSHLWGDDTKDVLRVKIDAAPTSESDGNAIVMGTGATTHGVVLWGVSTATSASFDTGDEVCAASGLTCQTTFNPAAPGTAVVCTDAHTDASGYFTAMCK